MSLTEIMTYNMVVLNYKTLSDSEDGNGKFKHFSSLQITKEASLGWIDKTIMKKVLYNPQDVGRILAMVFKIDELSQ